MTDISSYPVVILCGGRGLRLGERTESIPKLLVEVGGRPILEHVMWIYATAGCRDFILCLGYRGEQIREHFVNQTTWRGRDFTLSMRGRGEEYVRYRGDVEDWNITFVDTGLDAETGSRLRQIERYVGADTFFVSYADGVSDIYPAELLAAHRRQGCVATMTCVRPRTHYGVVELDEGGAVAAYREKHALPALVNGGFFCMSREVFRHLDDGPLEEKPLQRLVRERQLGAYVHDGFWACMDTPKDHQYLNDLWSRGKAPWRPR